MCMMLPPTNVTQFSLPRLRDDCLTFYINEQIWFSPRFHPSNSLQLPLDITHIHVEWMVQLMLHIILSPTLWTCTDNKPAYIYNLFYILIVLIKSEDVFKSERFGNFCWSLIKAYYSIQHNRMVGEVTAATTKLSFECSAPQCKHISESTSIHSACGHLQNKCSLLYL